MYVIAGLGNPDKKYEMTRHNMGFRIIDALAGRHGISLTEQKHKGLIGKGVINGEKVILVKPLTYMNLSGECIRPVCDYYKVDAKDCIVAFDDISLDPGRIRIRKKGSAGGHNGIKSIIAHLGTDAFPRLKFGVGDKPKQMDLADYVLGRFATEEEPGMREPLHNTVEACKVIMDDGIMTAMNKFN